MVAASVWYRAFSGLGRVPKLASYGLVACGLLSFGLLTARPAFAIQNVQQRGEPWLQPIPYFPLASDASTGNLTIRQHAEMLKPFTVAGKCGAFVGQQDGSFEAWTWPLKLLSHFRIEAQIEDYSIPIDVNDQAAEIEVAPDRTTITYSHAAFTIREILFASQCSANGAGVMAYFQVDAIKPMTLTFNFTPEVKRMWPAENPNAPSPEWVKLAGGGGYYLLHTDFPTLAGAIAMPGTEPGILAPYQERPKEWPLQLVLHYDPKRDGAKYFPLLMAAGDTAENAASEHLVDALKQLSLGARQAYEQTAAYYDHFFDRRVVAQTPDLRFDQALAWAELSIDQLRVQHGAEVALVAGLYSSGDSTRPGFGWFFGRDSLYTLYAVDSYGDFALAREEFAFLLKRQRADGKIMHEFSQTAEDVDWSQFPYEYAAADATPLFLMAMADYVAASGDTAFAEQHWAAIAKAWEFERTHDADGDGIYDNAQGTGWVESWVPALPKQEIYLAALDVEASEAYGKLAIILGKAAAAHEGAERADKVAATLEQEYHTGAAGFGYAFSHNAGDSASPPAGAPALLDTTETIYPAVAWWDGDYTHYGLKNPDAMFQRWASHEFSTDWGTRDVGEHEAIYDPLSYHQGSVWPLFTGWASLAEYRTGRPLSGYAHLMQNLDLTWEQDLGAVTELLSGQYFQPMGRSTTHQLWSSAMVLTPALRGLFGLRMNVVTHSLVVVPQLPAAWDGAKLLHVPAGDGRLVTLTFARDGAVMTVRAAPEGAGGPALLPLAGPGGVADRNGVLHVPLPGAELGIPALLPLPGARTLQLKVLEQHAEAHSATWLLEAQAGSEYSLPLRLNGVKALQVEGATIAKPPAGRRRARGGSEPADAGDAMLPILEVRFPAGAGYQQQTVTVRW